MQLTIKLITVLLGTCCMGAGIALAVHQHVNHPVNYYKINEYLESKLGQSVDKDEAMAVASDWLKSLEIAKSDPLIESVRLFLSLRELTDTSTCNERGHKILSDNNRALGNLARYGIRAIDKIALDYAQQHANVCCGKYEQNFNRKKDQMDSKSLELVKSFVRTITDYALENDDYPISSHARHLEEALKNSPINYIRLMDDQQGRARNPDIEALVLREFLRELMADKILTGDSVREAYTKYLERPCEDYVNTIGPDVFEPAVLDEITRLDSRGKVADCPHGPMDYRLGLAYYKVCKMYILAKDNLLSHVIESVN